MFLNGKRQLDEQVLVLTEDGAPRGAAAPAQHSSSLMDLAPPQLLGASQYQHPAVVPVADSTVCFLQVTSEDADPAQQRKQQIGSRVSAPASEKPLQHSISKAADVAVKPKEADGEGGGERANLPGGAGQQRPIPIMLVTAADMYAQQPKPPTIAGGVITVLALLAALTYTTWQIVDYMHMPPTTTSSVEWSDTQGPFPALIRCTAPGGCWVSNRHNDRWSSHGDQVEPTQQGCMVLQQGDEYTMNITFTQNIRNGLVIVWDPSTWANGTTPGAGLQIMAQTNNASSPDGIFVLGTPVLGGTYLASYVETHNNSAPVAKLRREWFITYVSEDVEVVPAATACVGQLSPEQLANYTQATIRIQAAWYRVRVDPPDLLLTLVGNCGGALQLCLQAGAILLLSWEFFKRTAPGWLTGHILRRHVERDSSTGGAQPPQHLVNAGAPMVFVDEGTGRQYSFLLSPGPAGTAAAPSLSPLGKQSRLLPPQQHTAAAPVSAGAVRPAGDAAMQRCVTFTLPSPSSADGSSHVLQKQRNVLRPATPIRHMFNQVVHSMGRGLANMSLSGSGAVGTALRGLSIGGHTPAAGSSSGGGHSVSGVAGDGNVRQLPGLIITSSSGSAAGGSNDASTPGY